MLYVSANLLLWKKNKRVNVYCTLINCPQEAAFSAGSEWSFISASLCCLHLGLNSFPNIPLPVSDSWVTGSSFCEAAPSTSGYKSLCFTLQLLPINFSSVSWSYIIIKSDSFSIWHHFKYWSNSYLQLSVLGKISAVVSFPDITDFLICLAYFTFELYHLLYLRLSGFVAAYSRNNFC